MKRILLITGFIISFAAAVGALKFINAAHLINPAYLSQATGTEKSNLVVNSRLTIEKKCIAPDKSGSHHYHRKNYE